MRIPLRQSWLLLFFILMCSRSAFAGPIDTLKQRGGEYIDSIQQPGKNTFIGAPTVSYAPETQLAVGVYGMYYFNLDRGGGATRPSRAELSSFYTSRRQLSISLFWEIFFKDDSYVCAGMGQYMRFSEFFFGIGNDLPLDGQLYSFQFWRLFNRFQKRIYSRFFAGLQYHGQLMYDLNFPPTHPFATETITGTKGGKSSGFGYALTWDSRDLPLTPSQGSYIDFSATYFGTAFSSNFTFSNYTLDARKYIPIGVRHVIAVQGFAQHNTGNPPFRMLAMPGNNMIMRGYYPGRLRERDFVAAQAEYRFPLFWRIGGTVFGCLGQVAHRMRDLQLNGFHPAYGFGIRFKFDRKQNINIRADFGFGPNGINGQYFTVGEAF